MVIISLMRSSGTMPVRTVSEEQKRSSLGSVVMLVRQISSPPYDVREIRPRAGGVQAFSGVIAPARRRDADNR